MRGLEFLVLSVFTLLLYCGWLFVIVKVYRHIDGGKLLTPLKLLVGLSLSLAPFHEALVYPLMKNECSRNGRIVTYTTPSAIPRDLLIDGAFYKLPSRYPLSDLFSSGALDSVTFGINGHYGEGGEIKSAAELYDANPFSLRISNSSDVSCGPFFDFASKSELPGFSVTEENNCLAISKENIPNRYIHISKKDETDRSWRTAFHAIEWKNVNYDLVENTEKKPILELREFAHGGLKLPILMGVFSVGAYTCKAEDNPHKTLMGILHAQGKSSNNTKIFADYSRSQVSALTHRYWGFELPEKIYSYEVRFWDDDGLSSKKSPLSVTLNIPKHNAPVKITLESNATIEWHIEAADEQFVLAENLFPKEGSTVSGLAIQQIWPYGEKEVAGNPLRRFYSERIMAAEREAIFSKRHCKISYHAKSAATTLDINSCNDAITAR
jgi:hypothetical protein